MEGCCVLEWKAIQAEKLEEMVALWNETLGEDFPMRKELFKQNTIKDKNVCCVSSRMVLDDSGKVIAYLIAKRWQEEIDVAVDPDRMSGWIQIVLVAKEYHNQGIGTKLLEHAEMELRHQGVQKIYLGSDLRHYFPGIPRAYKATQTWFERRGYDRQGEEVDLIQHYGPDQVVKFPERNDVEFSLLQPEEATAFITFLHRSFPGRWEYEAINYFKNGGTGREFAVLKKANNIVGFCRINDAKSPHIGPNVYWAPLIDCELGGVGPLGIDEAERGHGYGLSIVEAGIAFLRARGIQDIVIDWTDLITFYEKLGYDVWKRYRTYRKAL